MAVEVTVNDPVGATKPKNRPPTQPAEDEVPTIVTAVDPVINARDITLVEGDGWLLIQPQRDCTTTEIADVSTTVGDDMTLSSAENT